MKTSLLVTVLLLGTLPSFADEEAPLPLPVEQADEIDEGQDEGEAIPPSKPETPGKNAPATPSPEEIAKLQAELAKRPPSDPVKDHKDGSSRVSKMQDELSADVRQLILEQTAEQVIEKFEEADSAMDEATDRLTGHDTGGETMAAQTEVIEKLYEAAKKRQQQQQQQGEKPSSGDAMMEMMERMMGKEPGQQPGEQGEGKQPGDQGGEGMTGDSNSANQRQDGVNGGNVEQRTVPKASGTAGKGLPAEFQQALDAYNRGAGRLAREPQRK